MLSDSIADVNEKGMVLEFFYVTILKKRTPRFPIEHSKLAIIGWSEQEVLEISTLGCGPLVFKRFKER
jgi:hypothetical protein